jgi:hypothetical protein
MILSSEILSSQKALFLPLFSFNAIYNYESLSLKLSCLINATKRLVKNGVFSKIAEKQPT